MVCCVAVGCSTRSGQGIRMHRFPRNSERRRVWEIKVKREDWTPHDNSFLCDKHFDDTQRRLSHPERPLKCDAVPNVFPHTKRVLIRQPIKRRKEDISSPFLNEVDHCYAKKSKLDKGITEVPGTGVDIITNEVEEKSQDVSSPVSVVPKDPLDQIHRLQAQNLILRRKLQCEQHLRRSVTNAKAVMQNKMTKVFNKNQLDNMNKASSFSHKWSTDSYRKAFKLRFSCGTTGYEELLRQGHPLPSLRSLRRKMEVVSMEPGIQEETFNFLKLKTSAMDEKERDCCLTLDEMSIKAGCQYDKSSSCFRGDVTLPGHSGTATHALVFMLGGVTTRWKQTVAYHYTGNSVDGTKLNAIVTGIIKKAHDIGIHVSAITSDMGSSNRALHATFGIMCSKFIPTVNKISHPFSPERNIHFMFDVPHLIKNIKSALVNGQQFILDSSIVKKHNLPSATVSLEDVRTLVNFQVNDELMITPNLSTDKIGQSHFDKMKVSSALNFFSRSVSVGLKYLVEHENYDCKLLTTAWFIDLVDRWFGLAASRHPVTALSRKKPEVYNSAIEHLNEVIRVFSGLTCGKPWQTGVILTTTSILDLQAEYLDRGNAFLLTGRFTQDCLENLFSCVRSKNPTPDATEFRRALKIISVAQYMKCPSSSNYLEDERIYLADFLSPLHEDSEKSEDDIGDHIPDEWQDASLKQSEETSLFHLAGYCLFSIKKKGTFCKDCLKACEDPERSLLNSSVHALTKLKEFTGGCLTYCSQSAFELIHQAESLFRSMVDKNRLTGSNLNATLVKSSTSILDQVHIPNCHQIKTKLLQKFFTMRLFIHAKKVNRTRNSKLEAFKYGEMGSKSMAMRSLVKRLK